MAGRFERPAVMLCAHVLVGIAAITRTQLRRAAAHASAMPLHLSRVACPRRVHRAFG
jgi:hypothetical protein